MVFYFVQTVYSVINVHNCPVLWHSCAVYFEAFPNTAAIGCILIVSELTFMSRSKFLRASVPLQNLSYHSRKLASVDGRYSRPCLQVLTALSPLMSDHILHHIVQ